MSDGKEIPLVIEKAKLHDFLKAIKENGDYHDSELDLGFYVNAHKINAISYIPVAEEPVAEEPEVVEPSVEVLEQAQS